MADRVTLSTGERRLPVRLTVEREIELSQELASSVRKLAALEEEHKARKADMRAEEQIQAAGIATLSDWITNGAEPLMVPIEWVADFPAGRAELVRTDTGEVVETRDLTDEDRQLLIGDAPVSAAGSRSKGRGGRKREPVGQVEELPEEPGAEA